MATFTPFYEPPAYDGTEDITDNWMQETDPENERGEICEGFFDDHVRNGCRCALVAIRLTIQDEAGENRSIVMPRELAVSLMGLSTVTWIERDRARVLDETEE